MELLPGLPDDVALDCLIRIPFDRLSTATSVSKGWKKEIELPGFRRRRRDLGLTRSLVVMSQARVDTTHKSSGMKVVSTPAYRLVLCDPKIGFWSEMPPLPGFCNGLPMFCKIIGVGFRIVVLGGYDPLTWEVLNSVFFYDFLSAKWRRGADIPGGKRSFFAAVSDSDRMVFVAGGHDGSKNGLKSALMYDVDEDKWVSLPDMARQRDECKAVFCHNGKLLVIGGYRTEMQGRFESSAEAFDVAKWEWDHVDEEFLGTPRCPRTCIGGADGRIYMCGEHTLLAMDDDGGWKVEVGIPSEVANVAFLTTWQDSILVIGSQKYGEPHKAYVLNPRSQTCIEMDALEEYTGHVQSGCYLEI